MFGFIDDPQQRIYTVPRLEQQLNYLIKNIMEENIRKLYDNIFGNYNMNKLKD